MSYATFKVVHLLGVFMILLSLGGLIVAGATGSQGAARWRKLGGITNGIGLFLVFVCGFGLIATSGLSWPWPGWVFFKILIWLVLGMATAVANRMPNFAQYLWWSTILLGGVAAYLANFKPF